MHFLIFLKNFLAIFFVFFQNSCSIFFPCASIFLFTNFHPCKYIDFGRKKPEILKNCIKIAKICCFFAKKSHFSQNFIHFSISPNFSKILNFCQKVFAWFRKILLKSKTFQSKSQLPATSVCKSKISYFLKNLLFFSKNLNFSY